MSYYSYRYQNHEREAQYVLFMCLFVGVLMACVLYMVQSEEPERKLVTKCEPDPYVMIVRFEPARITGEPDYYCLGELESHFVRDNYGYWITRPEEVMVFREWECSPRVRDLECPKGAK